MSLNTTNHIHSFLENEDIRRYVKEMTSSIVGIIYNEIYPYIWFICIYNVILIFVSMANLYINIRIWKQICRPFSFCNDDNHNHSENVYYHTPSTLDTLFCNEKEKSE
jgi:hypothetical protein